VSSVARGTALLTAASVAFLGSSYLVSVILARLLGPGEYGLVSLAVAVMSILNAVHGAGIPQALSRRVAADRTAAPGVLAVARSLQLRFTLVSAAILVAIAGVIGLGGEPIAPYLAVSALTLVPHGALNLYLAYDNGLHDFRRQALLLSLYSVAKAFFAVALAIPFRGLGALVGYAAASFATVALGRHPVANTPHSGTAGLIRFALPVIAFVGLSTLQINADLLLVQALTRSSEQAGWYAAAQQIARAPYFALGGFGMALLPVVAQRHADEGSRALADTIADFLRYAFILLAPAVALFAVAASGIVDLLYSNRYAPAAIALPALMPGMAAVTLFSILSAALTGIGRPGAPVAISAAALGITTICGVLLIPAYGLVGAAVAETIGCLAALTAALVVLGHAVGRLFRPLTVLRTAVAALAVAVMLAAIRPTGASLILAAPITLLAYGALLVSVRELGPEDWRRLRAITLLRGSRPVS
jgi:stage V sporulation protein B